MTEATPRRATSRGSICLLVSWIQCLLHDYFEKFITFSLQLEIRHVNSQFEAYEPNFQNPPEGLPDYGYILFLSVRISSMNMSLH